MKIFLLEGKQLEIVEEFKYLGTIFTPTLTFTKHVKSLITRAKGKISVIFARTPINEVNLDLAMKLFRCYVQPVFEFNMIIWTTNYANKLNESINAVFKGFLKRYCNIHPKTKSSLVYHVTETVPFTQTLHERALTQKDQLEQLNKAFGLNLEELRLVKDRSLPEPYPMIELIPTEFWMHKCFVHLPSKRKYRRDLCVKIVDGDHRRKCTRSEEDFHLNSRETCICKFCGRHLEWYHECITTDDTLNRP